MKLSLHNLAVTALLLALQGAPGFARAQQHDLVIKSIAEREVEVKNAQGVIEKKRVPLSRAIPGAEVIYTTTFTNHGSKPAGNVVITNPVPENTSYVGSSALGDKTAIRFSVDGGKTYGTRDALIVRTADGRERPALPSDYTHIQWAYQGDLRPGDTGTAGFRVLVK